MDNTDEVSRESTLSSGGLIWPWNYITTRRFRGNGSICLQTDAAEMAHDRSHHMCQNQICQQWQHTSLDLFPALVASSIVHGRVLSSAALHSHRKNTSGIIVCLFSQKCSATSGPAISPWPCYVRITSADEPNVTCWVSGITRWTGSSIITSLMGLECSQSLMTAGFLAPDLRAEMRRL